MSRTRDAIPTLSFAKKARTKPPPWIPSYSDASVSVSDTSSSAAITTGPKYRRAVKSRGYKVACHWKLNEQEKTVSEHLCTDHRKRPQRHTNTRANMDLEEHCQVVDHILCSRVIRTSGWRTFPFLHFQGKLSTTNATAFRLLKSINFIMINGKDKKLETSMIDSWEKNWGC